MQYFYWMFFVIFLSQIVLISIYLPNKMIERIRYVMDTYPPSTHPKLYPKPIEQYKAGVIVFKWLNRGVALVGVAILVAIYLLDPLDDGNISEMWPAAYGMLQFVPLMLVEILGHKQLKLMRQAGNANVRKAELRPRRFFELVSPWLVGLAVFTYIAFLATDAVFHNFESQWDLAFWLTFTNLFMLVFGLWHLYGRKQDPHQATEDRNQQISAQWRSLLCVSIAMGIFFMFQSADRVFDIDYLDAPLLSLYFQAIALMSLGQLMQSIPVEDVNFDVYKDSPATP